MHYENHKKKGTVMDVCVTSDGTAYQAYHYTEWLKWHLQNDRLDKNVL